MGEATGFGEGADDDPFAGWTLDEDFVRSATRSEASAADRMAHVERVRQAREGHDAARRREVRARRRGRRARWFGLVVFVALAAAVFVLPTVLGGSSAEELAFHGDDAPWVGGRATSYPTPAEDPSPTPLGVPDDPPAEPGPHAFIQKDGRRPVAYDPCRPIAVVINDRTEPEGAAGLVERALAEVTRLTGLVFEIEGATDEVPAEDRRAVQVARYGDRWAPVLVAWSDPEESPGLAGDVAGFAGSVAVSRSSTPTVWATGLVVLDGPSLAPLFELDEDDVDADADADVDGAALVESVILHELGHLVGLDHVDAVGELMAPEGDAGTTAFGPGDRTGLVQLGAGPCVPEL